MLQEFYGGGNLTLARRPSDNFGRANAPSPIGAAGIFAFRQDTREINGKVLPKIERVFAGNRVLGFTFKWTRHRISSDE